MQCLIVAAAVMASADAYGANPFNTPTQPYAQTMGDSFNLLKYTGWQGPYSDRRGVGINRDPPAGTRVDQVVRFTRHGERWPDAYDWKEQYQSLQKILKHKGHLKGSLNFANEWIPFANNQSGWLAEESLVGPYSGLVHAYRLGADTRRRYADLYDGQSILPIFSSGYERVIDTARKFGEGFLQWNYTDLAALNIIPETAAQGGNSLVPACNIPFEKSTFCDYPVNSTEANSPWLYPQYDVAAARLNKENPGINLVGADIPHLLGMVAFELNVRGSSPWVDVFHADEWIAFEYAQSSYYYCFYGPGSTTGPASGNLLLNATRSLLLDGPDESLPLAFSFTHDVNIIQLVGALEIDDPKEWNGYEVNFDTKWTVTDLTPEGAHITFERLIYDDDASESLIELTEDSSSFPSAFNSTANLTATYSNKTGYYNYTTVGNDTVKFNTTDHKVADKSNIYVRVVINEAVVPLKGCTDGPGFSCSLGAFNELVNEKIATRPTYKQACNISDSAPQYLDIFWNYNTTNALNHLSVLPYRDGAVNAQDQPIAGSY